MLKYWVEEYDGFTIVLNQNTEGSDRRGVETAYSPKAGQESIDQHIEALEALGFERQESEGLEDNVIEYIETRMK